MSSDADKIQTDHMQCNTYFVKQLMKNKSPVINGDGSFSGILHMWIT